MFDTRMRGFVALSVSLLALGACASESQAPSSATSTQETSVTQTTDTDDTETSNTEAVTPEMIDSTDSVEVETSIETLAALAGNAAEAEADLVIEVVVSGGSVVGGSRRHAVDTGEVVLITVGLSEADQVHLHGYDFKVEGSGGETVGISFRADIPGVWKMELEGSGIELLELEVS